MFRKSLAISLMGAAFAVPVAQAQEPSQPNTPQVIAAKEARKGSESLRHFIQRTRMVYGLNYWDYKKPD